jgi:hypothetical protein
MLTKQDQRIGPCSKEAVIRTLLQTAFVLITATGLATVGQASCTTAICTGGNPCTISGSHTIDDGCILNFGSSQDVIITGTLQTANNDEWFDILAHSIDINGGTLRAEGGFGAITLTTSGTGDPFIKTRGSAFIDTSVGGTTSIDAAGTVDISGGSGIDADGGNPDCDGGEITISGTSVTITKAVHADGASCGGGGAGGSIAITATDTSVSLSGAGGVTANAGGGDSDGGSIEVTAETTVSQGKAMQARGAGDGWGGGISLTSFSSGASGAITVSGATNASGGGGADSAGGAIAIDGGDVTTSATLTANAGFFNAGDVDITAAGEVNVNAGISLDGSSGGDGGRLFIVGDQDVTIDGQSTANGGGSGSGGGTISISAGTGTGHLLWVKKVLEAKATNNGRANADGTVALDACDITVDNTVRTRQPAVGDGENRLTYRGTATVSAAGSLLADDPAPAVANCATATNGNIIECRCPDTDSNGVCDSATCVSAPTLSGTITPTQTVCPTVLPACS